MSQNNKSGLASLTSLNDGFARNATTNGRRARLVLDAHIGAKCEEDRLARIEQAAPRSATTPKAPGSSK